MHKTVCLLVFLSVAAGSAGAFSGLEIGIKGGIIDNYSQSGLSVGEYDINRLNLIGGQLYFSGLPVIDMIISGDYSWRKETYSFAGQSFEFKMRDFAVTASIVYPFRVAFVTPYLGGGVGTHSFSYEYIKPVSLSLADNGVAIPETSTFFGYHGIAGAKINLPAFPLGFFVEGRFNGVNAAGDDISFNSYSAGIFLSLP